MSALYRAGVSPHACRAILRRRRLRRRLRGGRLRRRADGVRSRDDEAAGGPVRGRRPPRARKPDGGPLRQARVPRVSDRGARRARYRVVGRPIPARARTIPQSEAREIFELPPTGRCSWSRARWPVHARSTRNAIEAFGEVGPAVLHISGERDYRSLKSRLRRDDYRLIPSPTGSAPPTRQPISSSREPGALSGRSLRPGGPRSSSRIRSPPATTRRRTPGTSSMPAAR